MLTLFPMVYLQGNIGTALAMTRIENDIKSLLLVMLVNFVTNATSVDPGFGRGGGGQLLKPKVSDVAGCSPLEGPG